ncbi:MAG: AraC family transcriptional regulator [Clostridia bacterium]
MEKNMNITAKTKIIDISKMDSSEKEGYEVARDLSNSIYLKIGLTNFCKKHYHKQLELLYILKGNQKVNINNDSFELAEGDLIIVNPYELHEYKQNGVVSFVLCIPSRFLEFFENYSGGMYFNTNYVKKSPVTKQIYSIMTELMDVCGSNDLIVYAKTLLLLSYMVENVGLQKMQKEQNSGINAVVVDYINDHYADNITLDDIAKYCCYSKYYISKTFNKMVNCNINDYINLKRIEAFIHLQSNNTSNISENALAVGFNSTRAFYTAFRKLYNLTPKEYLLMQKQHIGV